MAILFAETAIIEGDLFIFDFKKTSDLFGKPHVCCLNMLKPLKPHKTSNIYINHNNHVSRNYVPLYSNSVAQINDFDHISFLHMANRCVSRDQHMRSRAVCSATHGQ